MFFSGSDEEMFAISAYIPFDSDARLLKQVNKIHIQLEEKKKKKILNDETQIAITNTEYVYKCILENSGYRYLHRFGVIQVA